MARLNRELKKATRIGMLHESDQRETIFVPMRVEQRAVVWQQMQENKLRILNDVSHALANEVVEGDLNLKGLAECAGQIKWPAHLEIRGDLVCTGTSISTLPEFLTVEGNLFIDGTEIKKIPPTVRVRGWTILR